MEGCHINRSLSALGQCIKVLSRQQRSQTMHIPYRNSPLTWLLKECLGGNSRTKMIATISPSSSCFDETLSTLRYASRATRIVTHAVVNEDSSARVIRGLRAEIAKLKEELSKVATPMASVSAEVAEETGRHSPEVSGCSRDVGILCSPVDCACLARRNVCYRRWGWLKRLKSQL